MSVQHVEQEKRFIIKFEDEPELAELTYVPSAKSTSTQAVFDMNHTFVPKSQGGKGYAVALCDAAFEYMKEKGYKVVPSCSYIRNWYLPQHQQFKDLIVE